ncbi:vWA domain-containing protein [Nocardia nova]|uniref:vWA domain-containing protein n=1 Tax=Nocardia nova TaxID=37330 RepID=UPI00273A0711|nr:vWA domain-containing protein [Nocardia nova]
MTATVDSSSHRMVVVPAGGPITGHHIGIPSGVRGGAGLLQVGAQPDLIQVAVSATEVPELPAGHVALADELAAHWDIEPSGQPWRFDPLEPQPVRRIVLELPTELDPADAARQIVRAGLAGALLWLPDTGDDVFLPVDGVPHRVREIDLGGRNSGLACLTRDSAVELYASSVRAGVDIVVLADISGSMSWDDIPAGLERSAFRAHGGQWITRIEALKRALLDMLDIRLQISGRVSRFALLEFNHQARHKFPRGGGMTQLDGSSPESLVTEFRHAIALLRPDGGTDIGNALHEAANLLYREGHPSNEKLIVLVSDGANWAPAGEGGTGEVVRTVQEPVSLVAHLHNEAKIRLHAIGISTAELFQRRGLPPDERIIPNHALLEELVKVGGGDPAQVGGMEVLADYFTGLGGGISHRVGERLTEASRPGPLSGRTKAALDRLRSAGTSQWDQRRENLRDQLSELLVRCNDEAARVYGRQIWNYKWLQQLLSREFGSPAADIASFVSSVSRVLTVTQTEAPFTPLRALLDQLNGADVGCETLGAVFGTAVDSPTSAQVLVMQRVHDTTSELLDRLIIMQPEAESAPKPESSGPTGRFTYRD